GYGVWGLGLAPIQLVFVNGHYSRELSSLRSLPEGVKVGSLAAILNADPGRVEPYLARYASFQEQAFVALNTAFMEDGAFIDIPPGKVMEGPIHLLFVSTASREPIVSHPRSLIIVGASSQVTIVESYVGLESGLYFTNGVSEIVAGENAVIDHYKLELESEQAFHMATMQALLDRSSNFTSHSVALGGALVRNELNAVLDGEGGECTLNGLYMVTGRRHVDNQTRIDHVRPHCISRELYKGILDGQSRGVFNGKIYVHKHAQKTDARQVNKNLLLSEDAVIDTKPQLEIYNNDVKCSHGSTIGQLDQDSLFYLRTRGMDLESARSLLTYAFTSEMISRIRVEPIRAQLEHLFTARLQNGLQPGDMP
ncbi:MAG: Fe-S cluster assembly protein SufD, partial [candidate division NC10 bacterium]|nr:Fe-S cluster assembly protein SufD [candidate division NC10 bacterium]